MTNQTHSSKISSDRFNREVACFRNVRDSDGGVVITLRNWIEAMANPQSPNELRHRDVCLRYRLTKDRSIKTSLPAIMPSANMTSRKSSDSTEFEHSGFMQIDIDRKDNLGLEPAPALRDRIARLPFVALSALSASGEGVWCLIPISNPEHHLQHFKHCEQTFRQLGIHIDPMNGSNIKQLRSYSFDPDARINEQAEPYEGRLVPKKAPPLPASLLAQRPANQSAAIIELIVRQVRELQLDFAPGYKEFFKTGKALVAEFGLAGEQYFHQLCQYSPKYSAEDASRKYSEILNNERNDFSFGTIVYFARQLGLRTRTS